MYTNEGVGARRVESPLLEWCRKNKVMMLAPEPPGRNTRRKEAFWTSCQEVASNVLELVASRIVDKPYIVVGHSVGTWNAFEFLSLAREEGLPMPKKVRCQSHTAPHTFAYSYAEAITRYMK